MATSERRGSAPPPVMPARSGTRRQRAYGCAHSSTPRIALPIARRESGTRAGVKGAALCRCTDFSCNRNAIAAGNEAADVSLLVRWEGNREHCSHMGAPCATPKPIRDRILQMSPVPIPAHRADWPHRILTLGAAPLQYEFSSRSDVLRIGIRCFNH